MFKEDFPILSRKFHKSSIAYFDNAATTQKPKVMIDALNNYLMNSNSNIHRGIYEIAEESTKLYEECRASCAKLLSNHFSDEISNENIIFTKNTTESINLVSNALLKLSEGEYILISELEHHSNMLPWRKIASERKLNIEWVEEDNFRITAKAVEEKILNNRKIKFVALTATSNTTGGISDLNEIIKICRKNNIEVLVDAAQWLPHIIWTNERFDNPDYLVFSAHKMLGPTGVGVLYTKDTRKLSQPFLVGGNTVLSVSKNEIIYKQGYELYEAGTQDIASVIAFGASISYIQSQDKEAVENHMNYLNTYLFDTLSSIENINIFANSKINNRIPLFSFSLPKIHPHDIAEFLNKEDIAVRAGQHCTGVFHEKYGVNATTRVSAYIYNDKEDIDRLNLAIKECIKYYS